MVEELSPKRSVATVASPESHNLAPANGSVLPIRLFGDPGVRYNGSEASPLAKHKTQSLLAYIVLRHDYAHTRDQLATRFRSDLRSVRRALATARSRVVRLGDDSCLFAVSTSIQSGKPFLAG